MPADTPTPLCTWGQLTEGPLADLFRSYQANSQAATDLLLSATRACEAVCDRRLAPFTGVVETQRADALDVEDALDAYVPLDPTSQLGFSRAMSLGSTLLVRHFWVREFPPRYPELWTGSIGSILLRRSFSGDQAVVTSQIQFEADTGHVRFQLGTFVPPGTTIVTTYSGGYTTTPADLVQACKLMAASLTIRELEPDQASRDPEMLRDEAVGLLSAYARG